MFVRHGERTTYADEQCPLSVRGFQQARELGVYLAKEKIRIDRVLCSPFRRCIQTCASILDAFTSTTTTTATATTPNAKICIEYGLFEWPYPDGQFSAHALPAHTADEVIAEMFAHSAPRGSTEENKAAVDRWLAHDYTSLFPQAEIKKMAEEHHQESRAELNSRVSRTLAAVDRLFPNENLLFVTHAATKIEAVRVALHDQKFPDLAFVGSVSIVGLPLPSSLPSSTSGAAAAGAVESKTTTATTATTTTITASTTTSTTASDSVSSSHTSTPTSTPTSTSTGIRIRKHVMLRNGEISFLSERREAEEHLWHFKEDDDLYRELLAKRTKA